MCGQIYARFHLAIGLHFFHAEWSKFDVKILKKFYITIF
jgi:hypothetical protein